MSKYIYLKGILFRFETDLCESNSINCDSLCSQRKDEITDESLAKIKLN